MRNEYIKNGGKANEVPPLYVINAWKFTDVNNTQDAFEEAELMTALHEIANRRNRSN